MKRHHSLRTAVTLGTGLTALFLFVRCSVPERDYTPLGIGENAGSGGFGGDGVLLGSAGQAGQGGAEDPGDAGAVEIPPEPIPCVSPVRDAGVSDAGSSDAGNDAGSDDVSSEDAGVSEDPCACVNGFLRAVDADGDGLGTRACTLAPGFDCDDDDPAVTHNRCNGCGVLPNAPGEDCLDCGAYICDGREAVVCATKQDPVVVDPDCRCVAALIVARDTDGDGEGTRLCEQNPGNDCDDGDNAFITNVCGGCASLPGPVGATCNVCGVYTCSNDTMVCLPPTGAASQRCLTPTSSQACVGNGFWDDAVACANVCYAGNCEDCTPGTFLCTGASLYKCLESSSYGTISWNSWDSCTSTQTCNANLGQCTGSLLLPRDESFEVVPQLRPGLPWHEILNTASDSDYG